MGRLSRMDALQGQAMAQETKRRDELELKRITTALQRIDAGDYGYCLNCFNDFESLISLTRPLTTHCPYRNQQLNITILAHLTHQLNRVQGLPLSLCDIERRS